LIVFTSTTVPHSLHAASASPAKPVASAKIAAAAIP